MRVNAVSVNDTQYLNLRPEDRILVQEYHTVYAYDPESRTYLCEMTPSYELRYLHSYLILRGEVDDDKRAELDEHYCSDGGEDTYMHCSSVKRLSTQKECGEFDSMEDACEHLNGNWPF
jgi:hypothetical protein